MIFAQEMLAGGTGIATTAALRAVPLGSEGHAVIARLPTQLTAFVGRALRGPLNQPVVIDSFHAFERQFGGLWQPATLGYAIEQYFEHGGERAVVVRVANGGRAPSLRLATAAGETWVLRGRRPGTREYLRAAVDYDGIPAGDDSQFNLVVQSLRQPDSELVEEQEIYRRVSVDERSERHLARQLARSLLVRLEGRAPAQRPARTNESSASRGYQPAQADGDDGDELTDYDLIGDRERHTGLYALASAPQFGMLCLPPLARERDVGLPAWLVAARFCRSRLATLVVDPPRDWQDAGQAVEQALQWPFRSPDAVMYFPRVQAHDRLRGRVETFANCGVVAGMIARSEIAHPVWSPAAEEPLPRATLRPAQVVEPAQAVRLAQAGINLLHTARTPPGHESGVRSLMPLEAARVDERWLQARRLAQFVAASILHGTRWVAHQPADAQTWARLGGQISAFLEALDQERAFIGEPGEPGYFVICDDRLNHDAAVQKFGARALFGFAGVRGGQFATCLLTQRPRAMSVRPVSVNRLAAATPRMIEDIETAILRGLVAGE